MVSAVRKKLPINSIDAVDQAIDEWENGKEPTRYVATVTVTMTYEFDDRDIDMHQTPEEFAEIAYQYDWYNEENHTIELDTL